MCTRTCERVHRKVKSKGKKELSVSTDQQHVSVINGVK